MVTPQQVLDALKQVKYPGFARDIVSFGMVKDEVVRRPGWLTREHFIDLLGATNLIPGPNSTEMAIHIGHQRAG